MKHFWSKALIIAMIICGLIAMYAKESNKKHPDDTSMLRPSTEWSFSA